MREPAIMPRNETFDTEYIGDAPNGHSVFRRVHRETGHVMYFSSEVAEVGCVVWDTFSDPTTVAFALQHEQERATND